MRSALHHLKGRGLRRITTQAGRRRTHASHASLALGQPAARRFREAHPSTPTETLGLAIGRTAMGRPALSASGALSGLSTQIQLDILGYDRSATSGDGQ